MADETNFFGEFETKMRRAGVKEAPIRAFRHNYNSLQSGDTGQIPEAEIESVGELPELEQVKSSIAPRPELLGHVVLLKLNGGLGTSMGLESPKSLLPVKEGLTFLDFIVKQILHIRRQVGVPLRFALMNSYSTSAETKERLRKYPELGSPDELELMQSQAPKVDAHTRRPAAWPANPQLEWCPPGHGDIYPSLLDSGLLDRWLDAGCNYLFVSNSDNLGASLDLNVLSYFASTGKPFLMEVASRTPSDSKGGHLARRGGRFLLRESAQCPKADLPSFRDIKQHRFFNTNNLWLRLDSLKELLTKNAGFVPLPLIKNEKTVDPRDPKSTPVFQLETAMGAAIQCFDNSGGLLVPRTRFAPVKTTADLLALRSDAYEITEDWRLALAGPAGRKPPTINLDSNHYKLVDQLDQKLDGGAPSLKECQELTIEGPVVLSPKNIFAGSVKITNPSSRPAALPPGRYENCQQQLS